MLRRWLGGATFVAAHNAAFGPERAAGLLRAATGCERRGLGDHAPARCRGVSPYEVSEVPQPAGPAAGRAAPRLGNAHRLSSSKLRR